MNGPDHPDSIFQAWLSYWDAGVGYYPYDPPSPNGQAPSDDTPSDGGDDAPTDDEQPPPSELPRPPPLATLS